MIAIEIFFAESAKKICYGEYLNPNKLYEPDTSQNFLCTSRIVRNSYHIPSPRIFKQLRQIFVNCSSDHVEPGPEKSIEETPLVRAQI